MEYDLHLYNNSELEQMERQYRRDARTLLFKADQCAAIRAGRDAVMILHEAERAQKRAREGTCNCPSPAGSCPVHQMGGKEVL